MKCIRREVEILLDQNKALAVAAVKTASLAGPLLTPGALDQAQIALRKNLPWTEARLRTLRARVPLRKELVRRCLTRNPELRERASEHLDYVRIRDRALVIQRGILRQIGDTLAWNTLNQEHQLIARLYAKRPNQVATGVGLGGVVKLQADIHANARFLALDSDLTRCVGVGDLVVVPFGRPWRQPLPLEIKSRGTLVLGAQVRVSVLAAVSPESEAGETFAELMTFLDLMEDNAPTTDRRAQRQAEELVERGSLLDQASRMVVRGGSSPTTGNIDTIAEALRQALTTGKALLTIDSELAYAAIRVVDEDDPREASETLLSELTNKGFTETYSHISSDDFQENEEHSALIPPIPLWRIEPELREGLLDRRLLLVCAFHRDLWARAFAAQGLTLRIEDGGWLISSSMGSVRFSPFDVDRLMLGVAFAGVDPLAVAQRVASELTKGGG